MSPVLRPMVWSALLAAAVAAALASPAYADPALPDRIPDTGARPAVSGTLQLPGVPAAPGTTPPGAQLPQAGLGPLAAQISAAETQVALLGEQLLELRQAQTDALAQRDAADREFQAAQQRLAEAESAADQAAAEALKAAAALPPGEFGSDLHGLGVLSRIQRGEDAGPETTAATGEVTRARTAVEAARQALAAAQTRADGAVKAFTEAQKTYQAREAALRKLRDDNKAQLLEIERQREATEQRLGSSYIDSGDIEGMRANPRALAAVRYALAQLGDPYLWGAEGPDRFDCSGLMWAAYRSKGADYTDLPRVSRDQYYATRHKSVDRSALLPGDLIFFASGSNWQSIHHVGMYIGGGKMVHAPTTGDVVKISTVWWSRFYAATRVFDAVPGPDTPATSKPPAKTPPTKNPPTQKPKPPRPTPTPTPPTTEPPTPLPRPPVSDMPPPPTTEPAPSSTESSPVDSGSDTTSPSPSTDTTGTEPSGTDPTVTESATATESPAG